MTSARDSIVYFVQRADGGPIKIGTTSTGIESRIIGMQTASSSRLVALHFTPGDTKLEHRLHGLFAADRLRGEWFTDSPALLDFIAQLKAAGHIGQGRLLRMLSGWLPGARLPGEAARRFRVYVSAFARPGFWTLYGETNEQAHVPMWLSELDSLPEERRPEWILTDAVKSTEIRGKRTEA